MGIVLQREALEERLMLQGKGKGLHPGLCEKAMEEEVPNDLVAAIVIVVVMDTPIFLPLCLC